MPPERVTVPAPELEQVVTDIYVAHGLRAADAATLARVLVWANLRGVDSHGVSRALRYVELCEKGEANAQPEIAISHPRPAVVAVEADRAPGPVALDAAMRAAIETARETGVAWAGVRATTLTGAIGYYTSLAADAGMIGIGIVAGMPNMAYEGAKGAAVATSPLSIAVPAASQPTVLLDMATAVIALGKITQYKNRGEPLPEGVAVTKEGEPTTDPELAAVPLPLGGAKGSGMSLVFELLTSVLTGNAIVSAFHSGDKRHRQNAALIALDVEAFTPLDEFKQSVDETLTALKNLGDDVRFPGERGASVEAERRANGIPLPKKLWESLTAASV
ncbi:MAG TPA: Ldh family oxidoreductase [Gaiellaceae bacterium]|nr:Ldh family oxidoreductase [Gaiellaceae bacterium]